MVLLPDNGFFLDDLAFIVSVNISADYISDYTIEKRVMFFGNDQNTVA